MRVGEPATLSEKKLSCPMVGKAPLFEEWKPWDFVEGEPQDGWYYTTRDLAEIRDEFLRRKIVPRQSLSDFMHIRKLSAGKVVIQRVPNQWEKIKAFADSLQMPWTGQGIPSVTQSALFFFMRPKREGCRQHFQLLLERQGGACAGCGREDSLECDHIMPISTDPFNRNDVDNLQLLCSECHLEKTVAQSWKEPYNPLLSYFNDHVWQEFVMSPRVPQLITCYNHRNFKTIRKKRVYKSGPGLFKIIGKCNAFKSSEQR